MMKMNCATISYSEAECVLGFEIGSRDRTSDTRTQLHRGAQRDFLSGTEGWGARSHHLSSLSEDGEREQKTSVWCAVKVWLD
jgi:hypothetical protein